MRPEGSSLDLNYLPRDSIRDDQYTVSVSGRRRARRRGDYEENNESNDGNNSKLYECRFCSQKFCKSQALGGHMNRHRHEREAETLDKARQLVYGTDPSLGAGSTYMAAGSMYLHNNPSDYQVYNMGGGAAMYPSDHHHQVYHYHDHDHHTSAATVPYFAAEGLMSSRGHGGSSSSLSSSLCTSTTTASHLYCDPSTCCTNGASIGLDGPPMNRWAPSPHPY